MLVFHIVFTIFNLLFVGFTGFMINMLLIFVCLSIYYTLNQCSIVVYTILLGNAVVGGVLYEMFGINDEAGDKGYSDLNAIQKIGVILNCVFYGISFFWLTISYWQYFKSGGIKGLDCTREQLEEWEQAAIEMTSKPKNSKSRSASQSGIKEPLLPNQDRSDGV